MFIELHLLQNFAPSNLNRDDTGNPKDCEFGGTRRARISSQCLKRAIRQAEVFAETTQVPNGTRTKLIIGEILKRFTEDQRDVAKPIVTQLVQKFLSKLDKKNPDKTAVLLYITDNEITTIVNTIENQWDTILAQTGKALEKMVDEMASALQKQYAKRTSAPDVALFGRMLAENPELNIDAACQVAHAISTHRVNMEMDYYTAVDELQPEDNSGAGMVGFAGFNSACFYRYARVDLKQLTKNLNDNYELALTTVKAFVLASIDAVPSGKQNSTAAQNPPAFIFAVVRNGGPGWSLANAFEKPVRLRPDSGLVAPSIQALDAYWHEMVTVYGSGSVAGAAVVVLGKDSSLEWLKPYTTSSCESLTQELLTTLSK